MSSVISEINIAAGESAATSLNYWRPPSPRTATRAKRVLSPGVELQVVSVGVRDALFAWSHSACRHCSWVSGFRKRVVVAGGEDNPGLAGGS